MLTVHTFVELSNRLPKQTTIKKEFVNRWHLTGECGQSLMDINFPISLCARERQMINYTDSEWASVLVQSPLRWSGDCSSSGRKMVRNVTRYKAQSKGALCRPVWDRLALWRYILSLELINRQLFRWSDGVTKAVVSIVTEFPPSTR